MKAITLWQPWASLWLTGAKIHETRNWSTQYRGALAVHAALRAIREVEISQELHMICQDYLGPQYVRRLATGAVLGVVELVDCVTTNGFIPISRQDIVCGDFSADRWAWRRGAVIQKFARPIDSRGRQRLWNWQRGQLEVNP